MNESLKNIGLLIDMLRKAYQLTTNEKSKEIMKITHEKLARRYSERIQLINNYNTIK